MIVGLFYDIYLWHAMPPGKVLETQTMTLFLDQTCLILKALSSRRKGSLT